MQQAGIGNDFSENIFLFAKQNWANDYEMELYTVEKQISSGVAFFGYENAALPPDILQEIKVNAFSQWPNDHEMKLYTLEKQVESWVAINS